MNHWPFIIAAYGITIAGTLAIHATRPNIFSHDDLRLLDAIATLASSAISNAMLYEKTEELAIKRKVAAKPAPKPKYSCVGLA